MERIHLLLALLAIWMPQVWCQTVEITNVEVTFDQDSDTYIEMNGAHELVFDVAITVGGTVGADDAAINRWVLEVTLLDTMAAPNTIAGMQTLSRGNGLTHAQADLLIRAGETGIMQDVTWPVNLSAFTCPTLADADNMNYVLKVELKEGVKEPATAYSLTAGAGAALPLEDDDPPSLTCRGVEASVVPIITSGQPIIENTINMLEIDVLINNEANSRAIAGTPGFDVWDVIYTLEKDDGMVVETATFAESSDQEQGLLSGGSITIQDGALMFDLSNNDASNNYGTTCNDFDVLCVELLRETTPPAADDFSITGGNHKKCVSVACNGLLISSVSMSLLKAEELCQGADQMNGKNMAIDVGIVVHLEEKSAPLILANLVADPGTAPLTDFWRVNVYGSANQDCSGNRVDAHTSTVFTDLDFHDMSAGMGNSLPTINVAFDLTGVGCPQVQYICAQLYRNDDEADNTHFTYGFTNPDVTSQGIASGEITNTVLDTASPSSQWGSVEIPCKGAEIMGTSLDLNGDSQNLGEYTMNHRVDFSAVFTESGAGDCLVQGDNLWILEAFLTAGATITDAVPAGNTADMDKYPHVEATVVTLAPNAENMDLVASTDGSLDFSSSYVEFDLSDLDCQQGPFHMCVWLKKNPNADKDFDLVDENDADKYVQCGPVHPCVGVDLQTTTISEAQTPSNNQFPLRQGVSNVVYLIDVALDSDELAGSIKASPVTGFEPDPTAEKSRVGSDLWDMDVFLSTQSNGGDMVGQLLALDDRCGNPIEDLEIQAGESATFESVQAQLVLTNTQCHEFNYLCVTLKHGATHDQIGQNHGTDTKRAPTLEPISTTLTAGMCPLGVPDNDDVAYDCLGTANTFCVPYPRRQSAVTSCVPVDCRGVEVESVSCDIRTDTPASGAFVAPTDADAVILTKDVKAGQTGYFHLNVMIDTESDAGSVQGQDLWKMSVFLSSMADGSIVTVEKPVNVISAAGVDPMDAEQDWEDKDVAAGGRLSLDVWTATDDLFVLNYLCEDIRYICIKFEKGDPTNMRVGDADALNMLNMMIYDTDFLFTPNPEISCKVLNSCGGVILDNVVLTLTPADQIVIEKQAASPSSEVNKLTVDVDLQFNIESANFDMGLKFWDIEMFIATNDIGTEGKKLAENGVFTGEDGPVIGYGEADVTDRTTKIMAIDPEFDLSNTLCLDPDTDNGYLYLCVQVTKSAQSSVPYSLLSQSSRACVQIKCEGLIFDTPQLDPVTGGPVLEVTDNNELEITATFPLVNNGARASDFSADVWRVNFFLGTNMDGSGERIAEVEAILRESEARDGVSFGAPLVFSGKDAVLSMENKLCPSGQLYICAELEEIESGCSIDTSAAVVCNPMMCKGVEFTTIDFTIEPADTCLVEHNGANEVQFDFEANTAANTASVAGSNLWLITVFASLDSAGAGTLRVGEVSAVTSASTSLTAGDPFNLDNVVANLDLSNFVCPDTAPVNQPLYLCVQLERNTELADPIFSVTYNPSPFITCKPIKCKGVKINSIESFGSPPDPLVERSGPSTVSCGLRVIADADYASIVDGTNLWAFTAELRDDNGVVILSESADLSQAQRNQDLIAGQTTEFADISVTFDMDRNTYCPASGEFNLCLVITKGNNPSPDFTIDVTSVTEDCRPIPCRGVCIDDSRAEATSGSPLQEGVVEHEVWLDAVFHSDSQWAGIVETDARDLWEVNVFANPSSNGLGTRFAEEPGTLGTNNANRPLPAGEDLELRNIYAKLDFTPYPYLTCTDIRYICVELKQGTSSTPEFALSGCPAPYLIACAEFECQGVLIERVVLQPNPTFGTLKENTQQYVVTFDLLITPGELTSVLTDGTGAPTGQYWGVEIYGYNTVTEERTAVTIVNIPPIENLRGIQRPGSVYDPLQDTTLNLLTATMDLSDAYCGDLEQLCARLLRGAMADPAFSLSGVDGEENLIGCVPVTCEGVDVDSATIGADTVDPECLAEGSHSWQIEFDADFATNPLGGGVFGTNLWRIATYLSITDGGVAIDLNSDGFTDVSYPTLTGGQQSQTLTPGSALGFQSVKTTFDTRGLVCPADNVWFCVRLEKGLQSTSEFSLTSPEEDRTDCEMVECKGLVLTTMDFSTDRTIITEREDDQDFVIDIIAETNPDAGSVSGSDLWTVTIFFNGAADGTGAIFGETVTAELSDDNADRSVSAGDNLVFNDVEVDLSAANVLCGSGDVYICVQIGRDTGSEPGFTLTGDTLRCKEITCNSVLITNSRFGINSPEYLIENEINSLSFEVILTSSNLSASIEGDNLWSMDHIFTSAVVAGTGTPVAQEMYELLSQNQQDRDLLPGESLILSDVTGRLDLTGPRVTCENIDYLCAMFEKNANPDPAFTLVWQGAFQPPWCAEVECRGVEIVETILDIQTAAVSERSTDEDILFDVTIISDGTAAGVDGDDGDDLWKITADFRDKDGNQIIGSAFDPVDLGTAPQALSAGVPLVFPNLLEDVALNTLVCPEDGLYFCVWLFKADAPDNDFTLSGTTDDALHDCEPIVCRGVQFTETTIDITSGLEISETTASQNHEIFFEFEATSAVSSTTISGDNLWAVHVFGSRNEDGSGVRFKEHTLTLSQTQEDQDLNVPGQVLPFSSLATTIDMRGVRCVDFQYFCAEIGRGVTANRQFSVQGVNGTGFLDDSVLIECESMKCTGAYVTIFDATSQSPIIFLENDDNQIFTLDAFLESDVDQESVAGVNLWAMRSYFNPQDDCQGVDENGDLIRVAETDADLFPTDEDQNLLAGASIDFNNVRLSIDYAGTCELFEDNAFLCVEVIRSPQANPSFTLLGNTLIALPAECRGVQIINTIIENAEWTPTPFIENANGIGGRKRRQGQSLTFYLDILAETNINAAGIIGSDLWQVSVYLSGDENCETYDESTHVIVNSLSNPEQDQDLIAGQQLRFDLNNVVIPVDNVLCMNARYVCARIWKGDTPSNDFTLTGIPDESALIGVYETDCRGLQIVDSTLRLDSNQPLISGEQNHQIVFSFTIDTLPGGATVTGTQLFSIYVYGNSKEDGSGAIPNAASYIVPIQQEVRVVSGTTHSFDFLPARLDLGGVSCAQVPYVCGQIYKGADPSPDFTLQPYESADPVFTDCVPVPCTGVVIEEIELEFIRGLPLLEDAPAHEVDLYIRTTASGNGGDAFGFNLWAAQIFISQYQDGSGQQTARTPVTILNPDENLARGATIDLLSTVVLDLNGVVCVNVQYICVDLFKGTNPEPDFTLEGLSRSCHGFTCKGVDFLNPGLIVDNDVVLGELSPQTHVGFNAYIDANFNSATVEGDNLFKIWVFASSNIDGSGPRYGEGYADLTEAGQVNIAAGQRSYINDVSAYLDLSGVYCTNLNYLCIEIWRGDFANPSYQIDNVADQSALRACQQVACIGVEIARVIPELVLGSPLIEDGDNRNTWINIHFEPTERSASIIGDNLWEATCFANSDPNGLGIKYSVQSAYLEESERNKDLLRGSDYVILENAAVVNDYTGRRCSEIEYICCTIGETDEASPDFNLQGAYGNSQLLTGCVESFCLGVGITSTRLRLDSLEILRGDNSHTFEGDIDFSIWRESRRLQEDDTWGLTAILLDQDGNELAVREVDLLQEQQDRGVVPGADVTFEDISFQFDLSGYECYQIAYVCVGITTQNGASFELQGVTDAGEMNEEALIGCSPRLECGDLGVDIKVIDVGERFIELEWDEAEGDFDTYVITYEPEESIVESPLYIPRNLIAPLRFDGLTPGQEYTFSLYLYKGNTIKAGPVIEVERTRPGTVDVTINRNTNSELYVQWTQAAGIYDSYIVELNPQGTPPTPIYVDALAPREQIFSGLREARVYTVTVYTVVGGPTGYRSLPGYASETTRPAPPFLELDISDPGSTHVDLAWIAPTGYLVAGFTLRSEPDDDNSNVPVQLSADLREFRVNGLTPGRLYNFHLQAFAEVEGDNVYSMDSSVSTRTYPARVSGVVDEDSTTNAITFEWDEPEGDVDSYLISYPEQVGPPQQISALLPRRYTASPLGLASAYVFTIVTVSGGLESEPFVFTATTRPNRPGPIRTLEVSKDSISIEWGDAPGPSDAYEVTYEPTHDEYEPESPYFTTDNTFELEGIHPHTTIEFMVRTISDGARSDPVRWRQRTFPDLPEEVEDFEVEVFSPNSVVLSFSQPEYPNGLITAYIIRYEGRKPGYLGVDTGLQTVTALPNDFDFEETLSGLRSGYTYTFEIQATNSEGSGPSVSVEDITLYAGKPILAITPERLQSAYFSQLKTTAYTIENVPIREEFFSDENGDIIGYAVLVVQNNARNYSTSPIPLKSYQQVSEYDVWPVYQTSEILGGRDDFQGRKKRQTYYDYYTVGTEKDCGIAPGYCNGELRPLTTYRVLIRAYTEGGYVETPWSNPVTTRADRWWFAYAAIPFMVIVLLLAIILGLCACSAGEKKEMRKKRYRKDYHNGGYSRDDYAQDDFTDYGAEVYNENANANPVYMISGEADSPIPGPGTLQSKLNPTHVLGSRPIQIGKFQEHIASMAANNAIKFVEEYENLRPVGDDLARLIGGLPENKNKNRFSNIVPYDYNRVTMKDDSYINASFIGGFNSRHEYIATQGPLTNSVDTFWSMVWENNCPTIVMMGQCIEDGHVKSEQYWPENDVPVTYGNLTITMVTEKVDGDWTVRDFTIQSGSEIRAVRQFNFTAWPNHGVPEDTDGVIRFVSTVRAEAPQHSGPMVIHCGAGIGRTSTFLAMDILMQGLVYDESTVDVCGTVSSLRKQRCCMVQTVHQYIFMHKAMLDILQGKVSGYNWLLRTHKGGSVVSRNSDQVTSDTY